MLQATYLSGFAAVFQEREIGKLALSQRAHAMTLFDSEHDPLRDAITASGKRLFRSPAVCLVCVASVGFFTTVFSWNFAVDCYVAATGETTQVQVVGEERSYNGTSGYLTHASFSYSGADLPDHYRLFSAFLGNRSQASGEGVATLLSSRRDCNGLGHLNLCYLPESPGVYVVKEDYGFALNPILIVAGILGTGGAGLGFVRACGAA